MNHYALFLLLFFLTLLSCNRNPELTFSSEIFSEQHLEMCKNESCSEVEILYLKASGESSVADKINNEITLQITDALFLGDEDPSAKTSIESSVAQFVLAYRDHQPDIPTDLDQGGYEASIHTKLLSQNERVVSISNNSYLYTGGAHGMRTITFLNFDTATGEQIDVEDLVVDFSAFETFVEEKFRNSHDILAEDSINSTGFMFDDEQFYVPTNVGISDNEMVIVYNPFEIVPMPKGIVILRIPLEEVKLYLDPTIL